MSKITKDQAKDLRNAFQCWKQDYDQVEDKEQHDMFGLGIVAMDALLASLEAEPVAWQWEYRDKNHVTNDPARAKFVAQDGGVAVQPLFTAQPAPAYVPDDFGFSRLAFEKWITENYDSRLMRSGTGYAGRVLNQMWQCWLACRAAMLQGAAGNSPAIPDDVRRMDWLVSKTVDVREPMVYGSYSLFWSQTITDEEDDYHATKLREQIDAAMAAENAAAPQQECKHEFVYGWHSYGRQSGYQCRFCGKLQEVK